MIVYKRWETGAGNTRREFDGWFLLGFFPLYMRRHTVVK